MTRSEAGKLGGLATFKRHGRKHMRTIGKLGARVTWERYTMKPVGQSQYAMVNRQTNIIVAVIGRWSM